MGKFQKNGKQNFSSNRGFGSKPDFKRGGFGNKRDAGKDSSNMHKAPCDECGNTAELPFRPTGNKPVLCNNCFSGRREEGFRKSSFDSRFENREPFGMKKHHDTGTHGPKKRSEHGHSNSHAVGLSKADIENVVSELHKKIDALTSLVEGFTTAQINKVATKVEKVSKKVEKKAEDIKKVTEKKIVKKVTKKPLVKKVVSKTVKKVVKKTTK